MKIINDLKTAVAMDDQSAGSNLCLFSLDKKNCYTAFNKEHSAAMKSMCGKDIELGKNMLHYFSDAELKKAIKKSAQKAIKGVIFKEYLIDPITHKKAQIIWIPIYFDSEIVGVSGIVPIYEKGLHLLNKIDPFINEKGKRGWISTNKLPLKDERGDEIGLFGISRDIRAQLTSQEALVASEHKYRDLVENLPNAIAIHVKGKIVFVNQQVTKLLRAKNPKELLGIQALSFVHPDSLEAAINRLKSLNKTEDYSFLEEKFIRLEGTVVDVEVKAVPIIFENQEAILTITNDITQRKIIQQSLIESELKYRELVEKSPNAIVIYEDQKILFINKEGVNLMAAKHESELLGKNILSFVHPDYLDLVKERMNIKSIHDCNLFFLEEKLIRLDKVIIDIEAKAMPIFF